MTVDVAGILYGSGSLLYSVLGSAAVFLDVDGVRADLTIIDKTSGVEVEFGGDVAVATIKPACVVRTIELSTQGVDTTKMKGGQITFNGATWKIENKMPRPGPSGESTGEVMLLLTGTGE